MEPLHTILALVVCVLIFWILRGRKHGKLPPGPFDWPIVGSIPQLYLADPGLAPRALAKLATKYGNVMWVRAGALNTVVLSGFDTIKAALTQTEDFLDRFDDEWFLDRGFGKQIGLFQSRTSFWKPTRRFTMRHLREFGFGKKQAMQGFVNEEFLAIVRHFDNTIEKHDGILSPNHFFRLPSFNLSWACAAGFRFAHDDPEIKEILRLNTELLEAVHLNNPIETFPILKKILPSVFNYNDLYTVNRTIQEFIRGLVGKVKEKGTYKEEAECFLDAFLKTMESPEGAESPEIFTEENLITILYDLLIAAGDATSSTIVYGLLWLTINPQVQENCFDEIVKVIGKDRLPHLGDKIDLPYVRATILEIHRRSTVVPLLPHKVYRDVEFQGYHIPKNTFAIINQYSSQMDPDLWGDPENFRPERFLNSEGSIVNEHKLLTFSIGKRSCLGEAVAEMAVFSFLTGVIQKYRLLPVNSSHKYVTEPIFGGAIMPQHYEIKVQRR